MIKGRIRDRLRCSDTPPARALEVWMESHLVKGRPKVQLPELLLVCVASYVRTYSRKQALAQSPHEASMRSLVHARSLWTPQLSIQCGSKLLVARESPREAGATDHAHAEACCVCRISRTSRSQGPDDGEISSPWT